jgi:alpha-1,2-mannosyltransferase
MKETSGILKEAWVPFIVAFMLYIPFLYHSGYQLWLQSKAFTDLPSFYVTARLIASGISPYDYSAAMSLAQQIGVHYFPFLYLPISAPLFLPLSLCSYACVQKASLVVNHLLLFAILWLLVGCCLSDWFETPALKTVLFVVALSFTPLASTIGSGQVNLIVLFLLCIMWAALKRKNELWTALSLTLAVLVKVTPAIFLLWFLLKRQYSIIRYVALMFSAVILGVCLIWPSSLHWWVEWLTLVAPTGAYGREIWHLFSPAHPLNQSINGAILRLGNVLSLNQSATSILAYTLSTVLVVIALFVVRRASSRMIESLRLALEINLFVLLMVLVAPLSWHHHLVLLLPSVVLGISLALRRRGWKSIAWLTVAGGLTGLLIWYTPLSLSVQFYGILGLFAMYSIELVAGDHTQ